MCNSVYYLLTLGNALYKDVTRYYDINSKFEPTYSLDNLVVIC